MKNIKVLLICLVCCLAVGVNGVLAGPNPQNNDVTTVVWLTEKQPVEGAVWTPLIGKDFGYGYLRYDVFGPAFKFRFKGSNLQPNTDYSLIYYPDPWPAIGLIVLASGTSNGGGQILLKGSMDTDTLPTPDDGNFPGAKIWLVPSQYVGTDRMIGWPTDGAGILFETALINYYKLP